MDLRDIAHAHGRGESFEALMALSGLGAIPLRAIMSCDIFKGLAREEAERVRDGAL